METVEGTEQETVEELDMDVAEEDDVANITPTTWQSNMDHLLHKN